MLEILKNSVLLEKLSQLRSTYNAECNDHQFLEKFFLPLEDIPEWRYSTGPIFDHPPYSLEMAGFDGGRILKKQYSSPYEARLKGAYSSGFLNGKHVVTIYPTKPATMPLQANFYIENQDNVRDYSIISFKKISPSTSKPPKLLGIGDFFKIEDNVRAYVGIGKGSAYVIRVFYYNSSKLISKASMITGPSDFQNDFDFIYNEKNELKSIECNGIIWENNKNK